MAEVLRSRKSRALTGANTVLGGYTVANVAGNLATVIGLSLANVGTAATSVSVDIFDGTNATRLIKDAPLPLGDTLIVVGAEQKVVLEQNERIRVSVATGGSVDGVMSFLEITP